MKKLLRPLALIVILASMGVAMLPSQLVEPVLALNAFIDPNGDGSTGNWNSTGGSYYTEIDEAARQPTVPTTSDNITGAANNGGTVFINMSSVVGAFNTSAITVWIYHNDGSNGQITVGLYNDDESTAYASSVNLTQSSSNAWHSVTFAGLSLTQTQLDATTISLSTNKVGGGQPATITVYAMYADVTYSSSPPPPPTFDQTSYRLFNSINSTDVGTSLAAQDTAAVLNASGDEFRLRMTIHVGASGIAANGQSFKLQFVDRGSGSCASPSGGTPASYIDVTTGTAIAYNNLTAGVSDGDALTGNANDPSHGTDTTRDQTIEESNNFTNSQSSIAAGEDGLWDFALVDNTAPAATTYCFRAVEADGTAMNSYGVYPQITTGNGVLSVDIVDGTGTTVASPSYSFGATSYLFTCDQFNTDIGNSSQRIEISNFTGNALWTVSIAATSGNTTVWSDGTDTYDFNDPTGVPPGCTDGGDIDTVAGLLSLDPSVATNTPRSGCTTTGVSLGSADDFDEGTTDAITIANSSTSAELSCSWQITGISADQQIPADQAVGNYSINLTITAIAN